VSYQGCYKDYEQSRDLVRNISLSRPTTPRRCLSACANLSYSYAGLQVIIIINLITRPTNTKPQA